MWDRGPRILLFPESRRPEKVWPGFRALAEQLMKVVRGSQVIWAERQPRALELNAEEGRFLNLGGRTGLEDLIPLVGSADLVISNDSGPMHLAAALGAPVLALFGPTDPNRFGPYPLDAPSNRVLPAPRGNLAALTVEKVLETAAKALP